MFSIFAETPETSGDSPLAEERKVEGSSQPPSLLSKRLHKFPGSKEASSAPWKGLE